MEALNKNKEEIEKILKEVLSDYLDEETIKQEMEYSSDFTDGIRKAIIKTSILWCETILNLDDDTYFCDLCAYHKKHLQTRLTWLKEQEKKS